MEEYSVRRRKIRIETYLLVSFFVGILIGTIMINQMGQKWMDSLTIYNTYFYQQLQFNTVNKISLFFYILKERLGIFIFLWIVGFSIIGELGLIAVFTYLGYFVAILLGTATMIYGPVGLFIFLGIVFPHYILYGYGMYLMKEHIKYKNRESLGQAFVALTFICITCIAGAMAESWINPYILRLLL